MEITQNNQNGVQVIEVKGRLTADCAETYKQTLTDVVAQNNRLVIDLAQLEYIDSTGLGAMVYILQQTLDNGGELKLARLQGKSRIVFDITKAYKIFDIFDTVEEAAAAIKNK
ncbi:STAS domain-containing protein [Oligosphaera ethanolica]|jgi:anti-sigma B factor antagonist|uniref:Anti-sigma factor antagonist n=1 Tax=Oligosphaera ethanolica TaxID=760260 RepID=A0AAE3VDQ0_9BACT|nr:STAS domain-containing protein [Oligosphaera ethanolica]MDQ0288413.1 anti-sigma B factor antagonist [Oligosphaera ethanolica]NLE56057.1 STAS domain-containing protein [Lentisphaerota bacterium]HQL10318.1 STAS domain-containing protein [Lentisphaeria bacterium]